MNNDYTRAGARESIEDDPDDERHGADGGYTNNKCRCDRCRAAHAEKQRNYRRQIAGNGNERRRPW